MTMPTCERDNTIELARVFLMFGICLLHSITQGGHVQRGLDNVLLSCVTGFVFISGYYGIKFKISKILRIVSVAISSVLTLAVVKVLTEDVQWTNVEVLFINPLVKGYWFLWSYIVMMCLAPLVDSALNGCKREIISRLLPLFIVAFGWSYLSFTPKVMAYVPKVSGFGALTFLTLLGIYAVARIYKVFNLERYLYNKAGLFILVICIILTAIGLGHYCSPFSFMLVAVAFTFWRKVRLPNWAESCAKLISPSIFAVYLLHANGFGYHVIKSLENRTIDLGVSLYPTYFLVAIVIFICCIVLDIPRRLLVMILKCRIELLLAAIDNLYSQIITR